MTSTGLYAGAGRADIQILGSVFPVDGFAGEHDKLAARVLLLDSRGQRLVLVVVDQTSMSADSVTRLRSVVAAECRAEQNNVFISAAHTFSAPHVSDPSAGTTAERAKNDSLRAAVQDAVLQAAVAARRSLRPALIGAGQGSSDVNVNRCVPTAAGWWHGANPDGVSDKTLPVIKVVGRDQDVIAVVFNYAVQSSIMSESVTTDGRRLVTADLAGAAARHIEREYGQGSTALFLVGAAGDQAPYLVANRYVPCRAGTWPRTDIHEAGFMLVDLLGERLGADVVRVSEQIQAADADPKLRLAASSVVVPGQAVPASIHDIRPTRTYDYRTGAQADVPIWGMRISDTAIVGLQAELNAMTGLAIRRSSPFSRTMVTTMLNGGAKYMPDEASYARITYQAMNSRFAPGSAEMVASALGNLLAPLHRLWVVGHDAVVGAAGTRAAGAGAVASEHLR